MENHDPEGTTSAGSAYSDITPSTHGTESPKNRPSLDVLQMQQNSSVDHPHKRTARRSSSRLASRPIQNSRDAVGRCQHQVVKPQRSLRRSIQRSHVLHQPTSDYERGSNVLPLSPASTAHSSPNSSPVLQPRRTPFDMISNSQDLERRAQMTRSLKNALITMHKEKVIVLQRLDELSVKIEALKAITGKKRKREFEQESV